MSAVVSTQASVLLFSGKLDPQTPHTYAEYLLDALDCPKKELVTFDYATHGTIVSTPFVTINGTSLNCGMELLVSYVSNNGDLQRLNRSCVDEMPAFNLTVPIEYVQCLFGTDEAYDGVYNATPFHGVFHKVNTQNQKVRTQNQKPVRSNTFIKPIDCQI
ncbi:hypothetical protein JG688_00013730 [Phytophthora aleatoria]|uniref:Peptidase S33 tripeptidyl aminopeptidase-like C-terminal domain-containing protein n=1 Tax=Phytophthora aleatoria TaxID=2496075 RepID=A0A8J5IWS1_9STRA|nr:hypothetical protein JG688_00013730 [Phytophthora aleatoria]